MSKLYGGKDVDIHTQGKLIAEGLESKGRILYREADAEIANAGFNSSQTSANVIVAEVGTPMAQAAADVTTDNALTVTVQDVAAAATDVPAGAIAPSESGGYVDAPGTIVDGTGAVMDPQASAEAVITDVQNGIGSAHAELLAGAAAEGIEITVNVAPTDAAPAADATADTSAPATDVTPDATAGAPATDDTSSSTDTTTPDAGSDAPAVEEVDDDSEEDSDEDDKSVGA